MEELRIKAEATEYFSGLMERVLHMHFLSLLSKVRSEQKPIHDKPIVESKQAQTEAIPEATNVVQNETIIE